MQTTKKALQEGFKMEKNGFYYSFKFGDKKEYELTFEQLLWDSQMYVALYKNKSLLVNKVVVQAGFVEEEGDK